MTWHPRTRRGASARSRTEDDLRDERRLIRCYALCMVGGVPERALVALAQRAEALELEVQRRGALERQMQHLLELTGELAAAHARDDVLQLTIQRGLAALGAADGALWELSADGTLVLAACTESYVPAIALGHDGPLARAAASCESVFLSSRGELAARFPAAYEVMHRILPRTHRAFAFVPVVANSAPLGVLTFCYDRERTFEPAQRAFKELVARQCALALERVRLLAEERQARSEAEQATRAREEILSVVSHDLRNPLGVIAVVAATLRGDESERVKLSAERIRLQAQRMARLLEDLVDFAGIQAGRIALARDLHAPADIIASASELCEPLAVERGIAFTARAAAGLPAIDCDAERTIQAIANLLSNAIKVTPPGGVIEVGATARGEAVVFFVRDSGPGIPAEDLPNLFQRHWRSKTAPYKGAGLGLSIVRGIIDAHGGRIWAESELGAGSTFCFSL